MSVTFIIFPQYVTLLNYFRYLSFPYFFMKYNHFSEKRMDFANFLNFEAEEDLILASMHSLTYKEDIQLMPIEGGSKTSTASQDSNIQIQQIMGFMDRLELPDLQTVSSEILEKCSNRKKGTIKKNNFESSIPPKSNRKIKKVENSPFHNYQKHLNNALKKLIIVPAIQVEDEAYKHAAVRLWAAYVNGEVKTKKILHFVFNEKDQYQLKEQQLKSYGLWETYQQFGDRVILQAKSYLTKLAIDQIDEKSVESYVKTRKIKKTEGLNDYVLNFKKELESGYIKRHKKESLAHQCEW